MQFSRVTPWLFVATWVGFLGYALAWLPWWLPTVTAWSAFAMVWSGLNNNARLQAIGLSVIGLSTLLYAYQSNVDIAWRDLFATNIPLLAMFVAISFLSLTADEGQAKALPKGKKSLLTTAIGIHSLGSVINLSAFFIFGDRLQKQGRLSPFQQMVLARCFCAAAWWSPFFVATGVALTYSPGMHWKTTFFPGLLMAAIAISFTVFELSQRKDSDNFEGYPIRIESLFMPVVLAVLVIAAHEVFPDVSVIVLICIFAPLGSLVFMKARPRSKAILDLVENKMLNIGSQFALFLAAGIFSIGLKSVILVHPEVFNLTGYTLDGWLFLWVSGAMIAAGLVGFHPIVSIAIASSLLLPLQPDPNQLAFLFLTTWAVSTASSPLSGFGLALVSRYQANSIGILTNNWYYALLMWLISSAMALLIF